MFRARKPSVQRAPVGKQIPPELKQEPRAMVRDDVKPDVPPRVVNHVNHPKTSPLHIPLPPLPLSHMRSNHDDDPSRHHPRHENFDTEPDTAYWEKKIEYKPFHTDDQDDNDEDLTREVRKDRKIAPENDPLFAQIFAMFPEEGAPQ